jgi:hypothetical protein
MYVVQASGFSKIFARGMAEKIFEDPSVIFNGQPFQLVVPRSDGAILFEHNKPKPIHSLLPHSKGQKDVADLVDWLTGGNNDGTRSHETNIYGVVSIKIDSEIDMALSRSIDINFFMMQNPTVEETINFIRNKLRINPDLVAAETAQEMISKVYSHTFDRLRNETTDSIVEARKLADARVKFALKRTHENLMKQYETQKSEGKGEYTPSSAEAIGSVIIRQEVAKMKMQSDLRKQMVDWGSTFNQAFETPAEKELREQEAAKVAKAAQQAVTRQ